MADIKTHYFHKVVLGLSITQLVFGVICIILQVVLIVLSPLGPIGQGIWAGTFFIVAGSLGILSSQRKDTCSIVAFLVLAILAAVVAILGLITASAIHLTAYLVFTQSYTSSYRYRSTYRYRSSSIYYGTLHAQTIIAIYAIMVAIAVIQAILAIVSSALACHGLCCGDNTRQGHQVAPAGQMQYMTGQQQVASAPYGQPGVPGGYYPQSNQPPSYAPGYNSDQGNIKKY